MPTVILTEAAELNWLIAVKVCGFVFVLSHIKYIIKVVSLL